MSGPATVRTFRTHPEWPAVALAAAAWAVLLSGSAGHVHGPAPVTPASWVLMAVAMMVPVVLPAVRHVAVNSLRRRRLRAMTTFLMGYVGVWALCGPVLIAVFARLPRLPLLVALVVAAAVWQVLPARRVCVRACHRTVPLPPTGWRAYRGALHFGVAHGLACAGVCGPLMAIMAVPGTHHPVWMLAVTAAVVLTRYPPRGRPALVLDAHYRLVPADPPGAVLADRRPAPAEAAGRPDRAPPAARPPHRSHAPHGSHAPGPHGRGGHADGRERPDDRGGTTVPAR